MRQIVNEWVSLDNFSDTNKRLYLWTDKGDLENLQTAKNNAYFHFCKWPNKIIRLKDIFRQKPLLCLIMSSAVFPYETGLNQSKIMLVKLKYLLFQITTLHRFFFLNFKMVKEQSVLPGHVPCPWLWALQFQNFL